MSKQWERLKDMFEGALAMPEAERGSFLERAVAEGRLEGWEIDPLPGYSPSARPRPGAGRRCRMRSLRGTADRRG